MVLTVGIAKEEIRKPLCPLSPHALAVDLQGELYVGEVSMIVAGVNRGARSV